MILLVPLTIPVIFVLLLVFVCRGSGTKAQREARRVAKRLAQDEYLDNHDWYRRIRAACIVIAVFTFVIGTLVLQHS
jgi:hypothetical protein